MAEYLVGVDNGGTMAKAAVFDEKGRMLGRASQSCTLETPAPGFTERDMETLWHDTAEVIRQALLQAEVPPEAVAAVACTGHGKGAYLWGKDGRPARAGIVSTDTRAGAYITQWNADGTAERAYPKTLQKLLVSQPCALLAWVRDHEPEVYDNIQWIFEAKDYIRFRLTGEAWADKTDYSGTSLMNLQTKDYDKSLLELFGIPEMECCLPPLTESTALCGRVTPQAAVLTGLAADTPVVGGMFDIDACALASGVIDEQNLCVIAGTWSINEYVVRQPVENKGVAMNSIFCIPGYYLAEESSPTSAGNLEWFARSILDCDCAQAEAAGESVYARLDRLVEGTKPEESDVIFLPYIFGSPECAEASAAFLGMTARHKKADLLRAVFEGIVFSHRDHVEKLLACRAAPACIRLSGGAAKSHVWVQMFADVLGFPVEPVSVKEPGALGCAIAAAVAIDMYAGYETAVSQMVPKAIRVEPSAEAHTVYQKKYERYCAIKKAML